MHRRMNCWTIFLHLVFITFSGSAFVPPHRGRQMHGTMKLEKLSEEEIQSRLDQRMEWLREKDRKNPGVDIQDLKIVHEDDDILVVDKPAGVLCVPSEEGVSSLAATVHKYCRATTNLTLPQMVVHRLGCDTAGLLVFGKNIEAVRYLHGLFRTRQITRQYEVLVVGTMPNDAGLIALPLMRDYEYPPYMRVSSDAHQQVLSELDPEKVNKRILEPPKASLTHYQVLGREYFRDNPELPVTRLTLTSMTGRTHQLNCHLAAVGHPIVGDTVYGYQGLAAPNGGLDSSSELPEDAASPELQSAASEAAQGSNMCVHAKLIRFVHPTTSQDVEFTSPAPF